MSTVPPVHRELLLEVDPATAFEVFTARIGAWWPVGSQSVYGVGAAVAFTDGKIVERSADGSEAVWGTVTRWEPPGAVAFTWHPGRPADRASHVEVTFAAAAGQTLVTLEHTGWDAFTDPAAARDGYDHGWPGVLDRYRDYADAREAERTDVGEGAGSLSLKGHTMTELPHLVRPMLASLRHELPEDEDRYGWELKWDGLRAIVYVSGSQVRLVSRNDKDMAASYPELAVLAERVTAPVILDGEIVALRHGRPDFGLLQSRMHVQRPTEALLRAAPVQIYVFDLLHQGQESLLGQPYTQRRARLEELGLDADPVRTPPWRRGHAAEVLADSIAKGLEGVVGKPLESAYHPDQRRDWIKVKNVRQQEVIVGGWKPGAGRRAGMIGSLLVGVYDGDTLRYVGHVGTGFTQDMLTELMRELEPRGRDASPFGTKVPDQHARDARWVEPSLVGEVAFAEWTTDEILRQPSWRGLRIDKEPGQVHRED